MKKRIVILLIVSMMFSGFSNVSHARGIEYEGYKDVYYKKLVDFKNSKETVDGQEPIGKDAALVSHFNGEIPALFTISYYKGRANNGVFNYKYRVYIYEDGELKMVRLSQNIIDNDADYNFHSINLGGDNPDIFRNDYYIARKKDNDIKYILSHMENFQYTTFDGDDEYYDVWAKDGYRQDYYRLEGFLEDISENKLPNYKYLDKQTNKKKQLRYFYQDSLVEKDNNIISLTRYNSILNKFKKDYATRLLKPTDLNEEHIKKILTEDRDIKVVIDNKLINLNTQAIIVNSRTLVPVRSIFEALDIDIEWDKKNQLVTGRKDGKLIEININSNLAYIDGERVKLDSAAMIKNGRTLVPLRFVAESIDGEVTWDSVNRTANISLR